MGFVVYNFERGKLYGGDCFSSEGNDEIKNIVKKLIFFAQRQIYLFDVEPFHITVCWQQHQRKEGGFPERRERIIEGLPTLIR